MKKLSRLIPVAAAFLALSCSKQQSAEGYVSFSIRENAEIADVTKSKLSGYMTLPSAGDFNLKVSDENGAAIWTGKASQWSDQTKLRVGNYSVEATYGDSSAEGFDKAYLYGKTNFAIAGAGTQNVTVNVILKKALVKLVCTDAFRNYFKDWNFTVLTGKGTAIPFARNETKAAFVDAYKFSVSGTLTNQAGNVQTLSAVEYTSIKEATCYTVKFDASKTGGLKISILFNDTVETVDVGTIELN